MQDTFFVESPEGLALRTHTSSVQVRVMEHQEPPIRTISPGGYRNEAISARAHCMFHQVEGLYVDKGVSFAELKGTLDHFAKSLFGPGWPSGCDQLLPFTEPSAGGGHKAARSVAAMVAVCKQSKMGGDRGVRHGGPAVLANCGIDPEVYSGSPSAWAWNASPS